MSRAIVLVIDSLGIGELPDAAQYGDEGSDTLGNIARQVRVNLPNLRSLGLDRISRLPADSTRAAPVGAYGRMAEVSAGKDSVTGHWELMGIVLDRPFPVFPGGFPTDIIRAFEANAGRRVIGNKAASGTEIIAELGREQMESGSVIVYTSADSVFQIAAHEDVVPVPELYHLCEMAFDIVTTRLGVSRVIARPFVGSPGALTRTANRRDFAMPPRGETLLDRLQAREIPVIAIGKIEDLFAGRGISRAVHTASDAAGADEVEHAMAEVDRGLIFANLVDSDTIYGHRNDVAGYAANLERIDVKLGGLLAGVRPNDLLVVTADHGNDPTTPSTDHSREYVPLMIAGRRVAPGTNLGTRQTFADLGQTLAEAFGVDPLAHGASFLSDLFDARTH